MDGYQQDTLVVSFDFSQSAEMPCVHRLITGGEECTSAEKRGWEEREIELIWKVQQYAF